MSDENVGFKKPPKASQFKKGQSGNPKGRPRKVEPAKPNDEVTALMNVLAETVSIDGYEMNKLELLINTMYKRAIKGEASALRFISRIIDKFPVAAVSRGGGVLLMPCPMSIDEWSVKAAEQQAKFREKDYGKPVPD